MDKRVLLICNEGNNVINFRKELILDLISRGFSVSVIANNHNREDEIRNLGVEYRCVPFINRSTNIFSVLKLKKAFKKAIKDIKPDIVFTFQAKPNIVGVSAAYSCKVKNIFSMVEGAGEPFQPKNFVGKIKMALIIKMYKHTFKFSKTVFFLNNDDKNEFVKRKIVDEKKAIVVKGVGINTQDITPVYGTKEKIIVFLARLIRNKGIFDYCDIAREIRKSRKDIAFELYGEETNQIRINDIQEYIDDGSIVFGGYTTEKMKKISNSRLVVFPSFYREGLPMIIMEAMALGKPVISTNTQGARDVVVDGVTGFIVPCRDKDAFVHKILELIDDDNRVIEFGKNGRTICENEYDSKIINQKIISIITNNCD